jgi:hypothetical protein
MKAERSSTRSRSKVVVIALIRCGTLNKRPVARDGTGRWAVAGPGAVRGMLSRGSGGERHGARRWIAAGPQQIMRKSAGGLGSTAAAR